MMKNSVQHITDSLNKFFIDQADISFAYLFGSQAEGRAGSASDIDVAVYVDRHVNVEQRLQLRLTLIDRLIRLLHNDRIDLAVLNDSPLPLAYSAMYQRILVFERNQEQRIEFEVKTMSQFFDRQYYYRRHDNFNFERIAKKGIL